MQPTVSILAFVWASPLWLWALGAVAIPLAVHLWRRQQPRTERWAAMQFIQAALERSARRMRIESLALLAARCLLLALLALAMAGPMAQTGTNSGRGQASTHRVLVIDGSASMGTRVGRDRRFDIARRRAREIVQAARSGDSFNLCRIGSATPAVIIRRPAFDSADVLREIDRLPLLDDQGDLLATLRQVKELIDQLPPQGSIEVNILSDRQRANWSSDIPSEEAQLRQLLREMAQRSRLVVMDLGLESASDNLSVANLTAPDRLAVAGRPLRVQVDLTNHTATESTVSVDFLADGVLRSTQPAVVAANTSQTVHAVLEIPEALEAITLEARIRPDSMGHDNIARRVVPFRKRVDLLLVDGSPSDKLSESASGFLRLALSPRPSTGAEAGPSPGTGTPFQTTTVSVAQLRETVLTPFECVLLCDVTGLTDVDLAPLKEYADQGGGIVIGLGPGTDRDEFARTIGHPERGLLPVELLDAIDQSAEPTFFDTRDLSHPILELFRGRIEAGLATAPVSRYFRSQLRPASSARVILPYTTGDAAILEAPLGQGRIILLTTAMDDRWGHWVLWPSFVPLMHRTVMHAMEGRLRSEPLAVGSPLRHAALGPLSSARVTLPSGVIRDLPIDASTDEAGRVQSVLAWSETGLAGIYQFAASPGTRWPRFAVTVDRRESDPQIVSADQLQRGLLAGIPHDTVWNVAANTLLAVEWTQTELVWPQRILWVILGLLVVESLLAWRFRWGVWAALGGVAVVFLIYTSL